MSDWGDGPYQLTEPSWLERKLTALAQVVGRWLEHRKR